MTDWAELSRAANARAIALAAAQPPQLVAALHRELDKAIETGAPLADLRRRLRAFVRELAS